MSGKTISSNRTQPAKIQKNSLIHCQVSMAAQQAMQACGSVRSALQQLRECLINCHHCTAFDRCELHEEFNLQIDQAIAELNDEWGW